MFNSSQRALYCQIGVAFLSVAITGCDGGSSITSQSSNPGDNNNQGQILSDPKLEPVAADTVIRTAMLDYYTNAQGGGRGGTAVDDVFPVAIESTADTASESSGGGSSEGRFSNTNVQESGVDESDRVKLDGNIMFALEELDNRYIGVVPEPGLAEIDSIQYEPPQNMLSVYELDKENSSQLSRLALSNNTSGMYLHKNGGSRDIVLLSSGSFDWAYWSSPRYFMNGQTIVSWIDASNTGELLLNKTLTIDGQMISSRKIDNQLILVTRFHPAVDGIVVPYDDASVESNRRIIEQSDESDLVPGYTLQVGDNRTTGSIVADSQCYQNVGADSSDPDSSSDEALTPYQSPSVVSIITVDLNDQTTSIKNTCFVGQSETMYVSSNALYLATTQYIYDVGADSLQRPQVDYYPPEITTEIHKFRFRGGAAPDYRGSASVSGHLGWYVDRKPFRMSEKDNNLRVVTFDENRSGSPVTLNILSEGNGARLETLSTLPNDNRPDPIGKPNENLYASRFIGDRAYLVTFRITDPLYVLDVSDPYDPFISGELELPGYSDYLHPVNNELLLGVGKDAVPDNGSGWGDGRGAFYQGVKLALFDVSDPTNPRVADSRVIGKRGTDSPALYQHHSFAWLSAGSGNNARMAIPLSLHDEPQRESSPWAFSEWTSNNMLKMEVDVSNSTFVDVPDWVFESRAAGHPYSPVGLYNDRAVIGSDGGLYVIHNGSLQYGLWNNAAPSSATQ